ncbi:MAG TPA: peptide ABC transporter [Rhodospirillaceae bacterium]|nr:peptide ABC transporter [Rhodospirillaceae bacterium]
MRPAGPVLKSLLIAALVLLCAASPVRAAERDQLTIGITQYPSTFHPNIDSMVAKSYVLGFTRRPFTVFDQNWQLVCMLCTKLPTLENGLAVPETAPNGKKGIAVTYTIRADAVWGDGTPITTKDVEFTWRAGRHGKTGILPIEFYRSAYKLDTKDDKTFTLHFDKLTFDYNAINSFNLIPAHVDAVNFDADPVNYKNKTAFDTQTTNEALYFGPYLITETQRGSYIVLERNPKWWGKPGAFKRIVVKVIPNTAALEANLLSGNIDMISGELGFTVDQALRFEKRHGRKFRILYKPGLVYEHIDLNQDNPLLQNRDIRHALVYAIDREAISQQLFGGRQPVAQSSVNPLDWVAAEDIPKYTYDPRKALELLVRAGFTKLVQGVRHHKDTGEALRFEFMTTAGSKARELVQQVLQSQWKAVGIDVRIKNEPARVYFGQTVTQRKFTGLAMYAWSSAPESVPRTSLHSAHIPTEANGWAGQNYPGFKNAEMDELIEKIEVELDKPTRKKLWRRLQEIYVTELPAIPLYFRAETFIMPPWLTGVAPTGHQYPSSLWVEDWGVK